MAALSEHAGALSLSAGETTWFHRLVDEGKVTLIADGLDEFPDPSMFDVFDRALEEARRQFGLDRCSVLVTGRPSAFALTPRLRRRAQSLRFQPQPLTLPEIEAGIADFFGEDRTASAAMTRAVAESRESVQRLLGIPLFLTLTCAFWSRGDATRILSDTSVLMAQGLEHLLARRLGGHVQRAMDDLARLAASACPAFDDIPHSVASQLVDEGALESYSRGSGILRGGPGTGYRFGIRPLAEYLAGRHVANAPDEAIVDLFSRHAWSNRWREPLFWMAGELWKRSRSTVALTLLDRVLVEVENDRDDLPQTLFQRTCDLIGAGGEMKELPETIISRLSRLLVPMKKNPYAADRIYRFEAQFRTWPSFLRDRLARDVVNAASRTYSHLTAEALGALRSEKGIETLVRLSKARGDDDIRQYTFGALGQIGTRRAIDFLVRELEAADSDGVQIEGIARALARAGARSAIPALVRGLDDPRNEGARGAVYDALADLGWDGSVPRILSDIERERTDAAGSFPQAFNILVRLASRTQEARRALERLTRDETDPYLQHIAANALGLENAITILLPDEISYPDMSFIAYTVYLPSELAGQFLSISREADPSEDRQIGKILARVARVDPELQKDDSGNEDARINWYHLVLIDTSDPERALDTLEFVAKVINEAGSLSLDRRGHWFVWLVAIEPGACTAPRREFSAGRAVCSHRCSRGSGQSRCCSEDPILAGAGAGNRRRPRLPRGTDAAEDPCARCERRGRLSRRGSRRCGHRRVPPPRSHGLRRSHEARDDPLWRHSQAGAPPGHRAQRELRDPAPHRPAPRRPEGQTDQRAAAQPARLKEGQPRACGRTSQGTLKLRGSVFRTPRLGSFRREIRCQFIF